MSRHNAPPVVYPLGRSPFLRRLLLGLWLAGLLGIVLWAAQARLSAGHAAGALVALVGAGMAARISWKNQPVGQLAWDGETWAWESVGCQSGSAMPELSVIADLQSRLLLRLDNQPGACLWLWAERSSLPERWLDLRRAVYSPHKPASMRLQHDALPLETSPLSSSLPFPAVAVSSPMHVVVNVSQAEP